MALTRRAYQHHLEASSSSQETMPMIEPTSNEHYAHLAWGTPSNVQSSSDLTTSRPSVDDELCEWVTTSTTVSARTPRVNGFDLSVDEIGSLPHQRRKGEMKQPRKRTSMKISVREPAKPQFRCCCTPVSIACKVLAVFELIYVCIHASDTIYVMVSSQRFSTVYCTSVLAILILITLTIIAMWLGLNRKRPLLILPHLATQAIAILFFLVLSGALFAAGISGGSVLVTIVNSNSHIPREQMSDKLQGRSVETAGLHAPSPHRGVHAEASPLVTPLLRNIAIGGAFGSLILAVITMGLFVMVYRGYKFARYERQQLDMAAKS